MDATNRNASPAMPDATFTPGGSEDTDGRHQHAHHAAGDGVDALPHAAAKNERTNAALCCDFASFASRLFTLLSTSRSLDALAADLGISIPELLQLVDHPDVRHTLDRLQHLEDRRQESIARAALQSVAENATDITEKRHAATTLLRAIQDRIETDPPQTHSPRHTPLNDRDARDARAALESVLENTQRDRDVGLWQLYCMFDDKHTYTRYRYDDWRMRLDCTHLAPLLDYSRADVHSPRIDADSISFQADFHSRGDLVPLCFTMVKRQTEDAHEWRILDIRPYDSS